MSPRAGVLAGAVTALLLVLGGPGAGAASAGPEPLWVPDPESATDDAAAAAAADVSAPITADISGFDDPTHLDVVAWMGTAARAAGLPAELPVMAGLVESGLRNLPYGDADSVGFFQMRLSVWDHGAYRGYLRHPERQLQWFIDQAVALRDARRAAGNASFGEDPSTWGEWVADVERPHRAYRGRYQERLGTAQSLVALTPSLPRSALDATPIATLDPGARALADQVLADGAIALDPRAREDLVAGRVDPRLCTVLLEAAARAPIAVTVIQTGHPYRTVNGSVSNHSFGRAADIGFVGGAPVSPSNAAAHDMTVWLGTLPDSVRPTEVGSPWMPAGTEYFSDGDHQNHLHVGYDDPLAADAATSAVTEHVIAAAEPARERERKRRSRLRHVRRSLVEPTFDARGGSQSDAGAEPRFVAGQ